MLNVKDDWEASSIIAKSEKLFQCIQLTLKKSPKKHYIVNHFCVTEVPLRKTLNMEAYKTRQKRHGQPLSLALSCAHKLPIPL